MATNYKEYVHNLWVAESSAMVMKGVDDYIKIAREKKITIILNLNIYAIIHS